MQSAVISAVISGHQRSSAVIGGHQRSSEVIRGHQRSSEPAAREGSTHRRRPAPAPLHLQRPPLQARAPATGNRRALGTKARSHAAAWVSRRHVGVHASHSAMTPCGARWSRRSCRLMREVISCHQRSSAIISDHQRSSEVIRGLVTRTPPVLRASQQVERVRVCARPGIVRSVGEEDRPSH